GEAAQGYAGSAGMRHAGSPRLRTEPPIPSAANDLAKAAKHQRGPPQSARRARFALQPRSFTIMAHGRSMPQRHTVSWWALRLNDSKQRHLKVSSSVTPYLSQQKMLYQISRRYPWQVYLGKPLSEFTVMNRSL
ncbi:MAG: hypothetical protein ABGW78_00480, partial [Pirellulales bacterium]